LIYLTLIHHDQKILPLWSCFAIFALKRKQHSLTNLKELVQNKFILNFIFPGVIYKYYNCELVTFRNLLIFCAEMLSPFGTPSWSQLRFNTFGLNLRIWWRRKRESRLISGNSCYYAVLCVSSFCRKTQGLKYTEIYVCVLFYR
jgi:hypothetical protein